MEDRPTAVTAAIDAATVQDTGPARGSILLEKYKVDSIVGFGGMGLVIKCRHLELEDWVAIKILREDVSVEAENVERFVREGKAAVKLKSEHVARIRDVGTFGDGRPFMIMEFLEGRDLGKMLQQMGRLDPKIAVDLALQACDALGEAHLRGIVHRDIKPSNLFVTQRRDKSDLLKVLDFGISKVPAGQEMSITQTASVLGTPAYMSPEQMRSARTVDARSDIWALGCVLYELVEGHPPFIASNFAELCVLVSTEPFKTMVVAPELTPIITKCLEKRVEDRYQTMVELATALVPFAPDPARAEKEVAKIHRRLGMTPPGGVPISELKSSPKLRAPTFEGEAPTSVTTDVRPVLIGPNAKPAEPAPQHNQPRNLSTVWLVLVLILLFGVGIAAGLLVTSTNTC